MRVGFGYDVHRLVEERKLILGGVEIPYEKGLLGHSDADVLVHALMDAMLGAAGMGDIGRHFPDTDNQYKGIDSMLLLAKVTQLLDDADNRIDCCNRQKGHVCEPACHHQQNCQNDKHHVKKCQSIFPDDPLRALDRSIFNLVSKAFFQ